MAKLALINANRSAHDLVAKYAKKRAELKAIIERCEEVGRRALRSAPGAADSCRATPTPTRQRNRCALTGRPRGTFRKFGLARNKLREIALRARSRA